MVPVDVGEQLGLVVQRQRQVHPFAQEAAPGDHRPAPAGLQRADLDVFRAHQHVGMLRPFGQTGICLAAEGQDMARPGRQVAVQPVDATEETGNEGMGRIAVQGFAVANLDNAPGLHHGQPVGNRQRLLLVVGDMDRGDVQAPQQLGQLGAQRLLELGVERGQRLVEQLVFMTGGAYRWNGADLYITRSGYTGEDGFEISVHESQADALARALLAEPEVKPIGLGARNSLRLEAGLCLYGNDIDTSTTPVEAALNWALQKVRRTGGERAGGFPGADKVLAQLDASLPLTRKRVGLIAKDRVPVREHVELQNAAGERIGEVTSGLIGPTINQPIAIGYVEPAYAALGTQVNAIVRGKAVAMEVAAMPFVPNRYYRG